MLSIEAGEVKSTLLDGTLRDVMSPVFCLTFDYRAATEPELQPN